MGIQRIFTVIGPKPASTARRECRRAVLFVSVPVMSLVYLYFCSNQPRIGPFRLITEQVFARFGHHRE